MSEGVIILGGGGAMAGAIALDLAERGPFSRITLADVDLEKARARAVSLPGSKGEPLALDVRDKPALLRALKDHQVVINSTWYRMNTRVMSAAIRVGIPYVDLGGLYHVTFEQLRMDEEAKDRGVTCLIGMGSTPGTMNVMAAHAASGMESLDEVVLVSASKVVKEGSGFQVPYSLATMLDEATLPAIVFENGSPTEVDPMSRRVTMNLPEPIGKVDSYATLHSELATLPRNLDRGLRRMSFLLHLPEPLAQHIRAVVALGLASREPVETPSGPVVPYEFLQKVLNRAKPRELELDLDMQLAELRGKADGRRATARIWCVSKPRKEHGLPGGTWGTGVPASIGAAMLSQGEAEAEGVVPPEVAISPLPYFQELKKRGIEVRWDTRP